MELSDELAFLSRIWKLTRGKRRGCWLWTGTLDKDGYGVLTRRDGLQWRAHRYAWVWAQGEPVPDGKIVCHTCDNRACVNPEHLRLGTMAENNRERDERGHGSRGERHYKAKLNKTLADEIRSRYRPGRPKHVGNGPELMAEYGISRSTLYRVLRDELWT